MGESLHVYFHYYVLSIHPSTLSVIHSILFLTYFHCCIHLISQCVSVYLDIVLVTVKYLNVITSIYPSLYVSNLTPTQLEINSPLTVSLSPLSKLKGPGQVVEGGTWEGESRNVSQVLNGLWAWGDPDRCDEWTYLNDPWACNYIAFTNCSNRVKTDHIPVAELVDFENFPVWLHSDVSVGGAGIVNGLRERYVNTHPSLLHTHSLLQRPHYYNALIIKHILVTHPRHHPHFH